MKDFPNAGAVVDINIPDHLAKEIARVHNEMLALMNVPGHTPSVTLQALITVGIQEWDKTQREKVN